MTRFIRKEVNLKSSVYNPTGQNYFEQLAAYNAMSSHLQRILLAKSVVDTRNKNYLKKNRRCKVQEINDSRVCLRLETIDDGIDKLAYDIQHHPMDILRIDLNVKHSDCCNCNSDRQPRIGNRRLYYETINQMDCRRRLMSKTRRISPIRVRLPKRKKFLVPNFVCKREPKCTRKISHIIRPSTCFSPRRTIYSHSLSISCTIFASYPIIKSKFRSPRQKINDHRLVSSVSQCYDFDEQYTNSHLSKLTSKQEEKKYIKFVYDITKEIMQRGLYTDKELQDVFEKHIDQYKGILNTNKMLYEIYKLKDSLNIADEDTDEELEDLIQAQKLLTISEIRPPTPPKILDENKIMEKLESFQKMMKIEKSSNAIKKSVTLIDANPELLVTERDVLMSLVEIGLDPKQIQQICKNLRYKSKDVDLIEAAQIDVDTLYPSDFEMSNLEELEELEDNDRQVSAVTDIESVHDDSVVDDSVNSSTKQEASSSTSNLISVQDATVETKETTESEKTHHELEITSEHDETKS
ncbi:uncharacterized protein LOC105423361 isoform X2 [Pogonomyrmex barbatus]|uniref:Uncharacterized protein LOC105423361 isoform X2 n=1 Tax=Pogonomyrmex barbatus TaxID=144034 RepID=A0A8N1S556_9HYME|nr:uncharacterized protein LOC105423361 isoform X2 [Pogonomyrmex barbatus]